MRLNLRDIIEMPGNSVRFEYEPDFSGMSFDSLSKIKSPAKVGGCITNSAGLLRLEGVLSVDVICICSRCLEEFEKHLDVKLDVFLASELVDEDNPDIFLLDGDYIDLDEVVNTIFVLNIEQRYLCKDDCKGLCSKCGKNLNDGPCACTVETDPRLAALGQLLENK